MTLTRSMARRAEAEVTRATELKQANDEIDQFCVCCQVNNIERGCGCKNGITCKNGHTSCIECVRQLVRGCPSPSCTCTRNFSFQCPICRERIVLSQLDVLFVIKNDPIAAMEASGMRGCYHYAPSESDSWSISDSVDDIISESG